MVNLPPKLEAKQIVLWCRELVLSHIQMRAFPQKTFGLNLLGQPGGNLAGAIGKAGAPALEKFQRAL